MQPEWWRDAVVYQIYPRSFADGNGDGIGDLPGVIEHLDYLAKLGVDAIWLSPFYVSPQADAGYDVADYRDVDPVFGNLGDVDRLIAGAHAAGIRLIVDLVPNHTSSQHPWFAAALAAAPGSPERARYIFRDGRGERGELPPNNWESVFGGPAWTRVADADGTPGQWYLHLFDPGQPDLDWLNPEVRDEFDDVLRFWLARGVDGFRIDVAHGLMKAEGLPDADHPSGAVIDGGNSGPMWDQDEVHDVYRRWRRVVGEYGDDRILVAEAWVAPAARLSRYVRPDEMHQAFNFIYMTAGWDAARLRTAIDASLAAGAEVGATTTWVLSNHDVVRHASRFGLPDPTSWPKGLAADDPQPDAALGLSRARAATLLTLALPGSAYVYNGEELGLPEHTTLRPEDREDPHFLRTGGRDAGRDGARIPLPWAADAAGLGFGPSAGTWLPQPESYRALAVDRQESDPDSTLAFYRAALAERRAHGLGAGTLEWIRSDDDVLEWIRSDDDVLEFRNGDVRVLANFGPEPVEIGIDARAILTSEAGAVTRGALQPNTAAWLAG
jgi:alpha-glucosidase